MKGIIWGLVWIVFGSTAQASNYPADYAEQVVRVLHKGPALFAYVGSGILSKNVIGYKNGGYLTQFNPRFVDAVVTSVCKDWEGAELRQTMVVRLGREWHGSGYLSEGIESYSFFGPRCDYAQYGNLFVAFSDDAGHWDSRYGQDYGFSQQEFWARGAKPSVYFTRESGFQINLKAWDFIVSQMRR